jgi:hypothetical protein
VDHDPGWPRHKYETLFQKYLKKKGPEVGPEFKLQYCKKNKKIKNKKPQRSAMGIHACNSSPWETEAEG